MAAESGGGANQTDAAYWRDWLRQNSNWGRWGADDQRGAINLIDAQKRRDAASLVRAGVSVSLARDLATRPGVQNPQPVQHFLRWFERPLGQGGGAGEYLGLHVHGYQTTHVDALCHSWGDTGMWNGREPLQALTPVGARWGGVEQWRDGVVTRGVLLDVARHRGVEYLTPGEPVQDAELYAVAARQGVEVRPGDALVVRGGRDAFERAHPQWNPNGDPHPGLGVSTLRFMRERDIAVLAWDFMDAQPYEFDWPLVPHAALHALGVALVDNCALDALGAHCAAAGCWDFMLVLAPLRLVGGTGSPLNPLAVL